MSGVSWMAAPSQVVLDRGEGGVRRSRRPVLVGAGVGSRGLVPGSITPGLGKTASVAGGAGGDGQQLERGLRAGDLGRERDPTRPPTGRRRRRRISSRSRTRGRSGRARAVAPGRITGAGADRARGSVRTGAEHARACAGQIGAPARARIVRAQMQSQTTVEVVRSKTTMRRAATVVVVPLPAP